ncbi:MtrAB system histidine kinase MtrB [Bifidobacterium sp. ESL0790]|uniref:MtrAB system histidine kinase MtrB n=1 Tax=Bifidobacterium sp. ESL0790 TaxID=2983233 RepID=UPI0023FA2CCE|nr:MtrAB system histidine kinase MtrB [Bifidobacterium sp. ESL0790]WEV71839.1 MtrAB system histidine kinase MtrB [Bifidobacterium sp. ESL0790]
MAARSHFRGWAQRLRFKVLHSLQAHVVVFGVIVSLVVAVVFSMVSLLSVRSSLFEQVKDDSRNDFSNQVLRVRSTLNAADVSNAAQYQQLVNETASSIQGDGATNLLGVYVFSHTTSGDEITPVSTEPAYSSLISDDIRGMVFTDDGNNVYYEPVRIHQGRGDDEPGAILGTRLQFGSMGDLDLFSLYSYGSEERSLTQIQLSLLGICLALSAMVGILVWFFLRRIVLPVKRVADAAETMAEGDLDVRVPVDRKDEIGTLQRSFNEMATSLGQKIDELEQASNAQRRFVSDVSHELRTPITTMRMASDLLEGRKDDFSPSTRRTVELLSGQIERFQKMLNDLLLISRYDAGKLTLDLVDTDIREPVRAAVEQVRTIAEVNSIELRVDLPATRCLVKVDSRRIVRIVRNLLADSIDFSQGLPIEVRLAINGKAAVISVRDHGTGMGAEQLPHIFERFWRGDASRSRTTGGSGLGLSIALADVKMHHGDIRVHSRKGEGTWFLVALPIDPDQPPLHDDDLPIRFSGEADSFEVAGDFGVAARQIDGNDDGDSDGDGDGDGDRDIKGGINGGIDQNGDRDNDRNDNQNTDDQTNHDVNGNSGLKGNEIVNENIDEHIDEHTSGTIDEPEGDNRDDA